MSDPAETFADMMQETPQGGGHPVAGVRGLFTEVMDTTTGPVWMSASAVELEEELAMTSGVAATVTLQQGPGQLGGGASD